MGLCLPPKIMIKFLEDNGFTFVRSKGTSHRVYSNGKLTLPVPLHKGKDLHENLIRSILKESGFEKEHLLKWLGR